MTQVQMAQYISDRIDEVAAECGINIEQFSLYAASTYHHGQWLYDSDYATLTIQRWGFEPREELRATQGPYVDLKPPSDFKAEIKATIERLKELS